MDSPIAWGAVLVLGGVVIGAGGAALYFSKSAGPVPHHVACERDIRDAGGDAATRKAIKDVQWSGNGHAFLVTAERPDGKRAKFWVTCDWNEKDHENHLRAEDWPVD